MPCPYNEGILVCQGLVTDFDRQNPLGTHDEETFVTVELHPHGEHTELVLIHERLPNEGVRRDHSRGWQSIVGKLTAYLQ